MSIFKVIWAVATAPWVAAKAALGCAGGIVGYIGISIYGFVTRPGDIHNLSASVISIMKHFFPSIDFDKITVRLGAKIIVRSGKRGMAIGRTIYLKQRTFDHCDERDMKLLMHELVHVRQYLDYGSVLPGVRSGCAYGQGFTQNWSSETNPKEVEARNFVTVNKEELLRLMSDVCTVVKRERTSTRRANWFWLTWGTSH